MSVPLREGSRDYRVRNGFHHLACAIHLIDQAITVTKHAAFGPKTLTLPHRNARTPPQTPV